MTAKWEDAFNAEELERLLALMQRENAAPPTADAELSSLTHADARWLLAHITDLAGCFGAAAAERDRLRESKDDLAAEAYLMWAGEDDRGRFSARLSFRDKGEMQHAASMIGERVKLGLPFTAPPKAANETEYRRD